MKTVVYYNRGWVLISLWVYSIMQVMKRNYFLLTVLFTICFISVIYADITVPSHVYNFYTSLAKTGKSDQDFFKPEGMCFSPDGRLLAVTDTHNNRLKLYEVNPDALATMPLSLVMIYGDLWPWDNMITPAIQTINIAKTTI